MSDKIRCAIYTRKSSEEGLEQEFNSLDAQYESCVAYIASQAIEGWELVPKKYDDGGISGGTINRLALQQLFTQDGWAKYIGKVVVHSRKLEITLQHKKLSEILELEINKDICKITVSFKMQRKSNGKKVILGAEQNFLDTPLLKLYTQARDWYSKLCNGTTILDIAKSDNVSDSYIRRMIDMAFLSPDLVKQLSQGKQPIIMSKEYFKNNGLADCWDEQLQILNKC